MLIQVSDKGPHQDEIEYRRQVEISRAQQHHAVKSVFAQRQLETFSCSNHKRDCRRFVSYGNDIRKVIQTVVNWVFQKKV